MEKSIEDFLTTEEEKLIINAIRQAEDHTSGEIRVHLENHSIKANPERTLEVFSILKMDNTILKNAVLIHVAVHDKTFTIYGDEGINEVVPNNFWDSTKNTIEAEFKKGHFAKGLTEGILHIGEQLKSHFPISNNDKNELPDSITKS